jgi:hypothetical protein
LWLIVYLYSLSNHFFASGKEAPTLSFDLGEKGGWVPFRNAAKRVRRMFSLT